MLVTFWGLSIIAQLGMSIFEVKFLLAFHTIFFFFFFSRFDVVVFQERLSWGRGVSCPSEEVGE